MSTFVHFSVYAEDARHVCRAITDANVDKYVKQTKENLKKFVINVKYFNKIEYGNENQT